MTQRIVELDDFDMKIIRALLLDASRSQRQLAQDVGLSQNACWRRIKHLEAAGVLHGTAARFDPRKVGLELTVYVMVKTRHHSQEWSDRFRQRMESIPEIVELHRIGGDWDYLAKIVTVSMASYDRIYQKMIAGFDHEKVAGHFSMETIFEGRPPQLTQLR